MTKQTRQSPLSPTDDHWHAKPVSAVLDLLETELHGLTPADITLRQRQYGDNSLPRRTSKNWWRRLLEQCNNVLIYVLLVAAVTVLVLGHWIDAGVIFGVVFINATIGMIQEGKAEDAINALGAMLSAKAMVVRNGSRGVIPAEQLVPGDIVVLQAGDKVPADIRLLKTRQLQIQEAILTGESLPVSKQIEPVAADRVVGERSNMAYSGTMVTAGQATGVVVAIGGDTELGHISAMLAHVTKVTTPLLRKIAQLSRRLTVLIILVAALTLAIGVFWYQSDWAEMFVAAVSIAVAAVPEGLPAIMTITLAIGVQCMAKRHAIIRSLPAVETLGSVTVICSDKTGTLTRNEMTVTNLVVAEEGRFSISGTGYEPHGAISQQQQSSDVAEFIGLKQLIQAGLLCNDSRLQQRDGFWTCIGDPTEAALISLSMKAGFEQQHEYQTNPRIDLIPFESENQFMASLHHDHHGQYRAVLKGAPERVLQMCANQYAHLGEQPLQSEYWLQQISTLAAEGCRVLAVAVKSFNEPVQTLRLADVQQGMTLLGLVAMMDPPREDAIEAIKQCRRAGIAIKMITGDHATTAQAVARLMGLDDSVLNGHEIEKMSDAELRHIVREKTVFSRASPEHKLRLVEALQANGEVVAMTGDGVNDAPALKRADIGTAMGRDGTEVARDAADMVLADDNFASIVEAVKQGRTVFDNLTKGLLHILPTNAGQALTLMTAILLGISLPVTPVQILWVNMITAVTLALSLAFEPTEQGVMQRPPREQAQPILSTRLLLRVVFVAILMTIGTFVLYIWHIDAGYEQPYARTVAVNTLVMFQVFYLFNARYLNNCVLNWEGIFGNRAVLLAIGILLVFQMSFTYLPLMHALFGTVSISASSWLWIIVASSTVLWLVELEKKIQRRQG